MIARASSLVVAVIAIGACAIGACGVVAGLPSEYELATDGAAVSFGEDSATVDGSASSDGSTSVDSSSASDGSTQDAATQVDAGSDASSLKVPPSDPANVPCGTSKCNLFQKVCCSEQGQSPQCQDRQSSCNGAWTRCDESADCLNNDRCCVTDVHSYALETQCQQSCSSSPAQSCRSNAECANGETCIAWMCAGHVVATCNGRGVDGGCAP